MQEWFSIEGNTENTEKPVYFWNNRRRKKLSPPTLQGVLNAMYSIIEEYCAQLKKPKTEEIYPSEEKLLLEDSVFLTAQSVVSRRSRHISEGDSTWKDIHSVRSIVFLFCCELSDVQSS